MSALSAFFVYKAISSASAVFVALSVVFLLGLLGFVVPMLFLTYYQIKNKVVNIRCYICSNRNIPLENIVSIAPTTDMSSSPALSSDRLKITFLENGKEKYVIISPKYKKEFLEAIDNNK